MSTISQPIDEQQHPSQPAATVETHDPDVPVTIIEAQPGWRLVNVRELIEYRDLFRFLV